MRALFIGKFEFYVFFLTYEYRYNKLINNTINNKIFKIIICYRKFKNFFFTSQL
jgi:hypothetical protein